MSAHYQVAFVYEPVPSAEIDTAYLANSKIKRIMRVDRIDMFGDTTLVHRYDLSYEPSLSNTSKSRLASIQECGVGGTDCFLATTFTYQNGTVGLNAEVNSNIPMSSLARPLAMDVNGDGRDDLVYPSTVTSGTGIWLIAFGSISGNFNAPTRV